MSDRATPRRTGGALGLSLLIAILSALTIATVWAFQGAGYTPCELCLLERNPFYAAVPVALAAAVAAWTARWRATLLLFGLLASIFAVSTGLAAYHAGVEWRLWAGPSGCSGAVPAAPNVGDFLKQLDTVKVVRCDQAALQVAGLSLAGWNVVASLTLVGIAGLGLRVALRAR